jgi:predicted HicB family RNase H-like nuclease
MPDFGKLNQKQERKAETGAKIDRVAAAGDRAIGKSGREDYQRTTVYLPKDLHRRLKLHALQAGQEMSDIVEALLREHLDNEPNL